MMIGKNRPRQSEAQDQVEQSPKKKGSIFGFLPFID
jgi:hypothetical protein